MSQVIIGCKLPQGIIVKGSHGQNITINGMNTALITGGYGLTYMDADEAAVFFATHAEFGPVQSQAIFTHHTDSIDSIVDMAEELEEEKTGFEGLDPAKPAPGIKPDDKQATTQEVTGSVRGATRSPKSKADKAAAAQLAGRMAGKK